MVKQTAGRDALNDFAPKFAELNDDVLFGEVWSREGMLSLKMRSVVTDYLSQKYSRNAAFSVIAEKVQHGMHRRWHEDTRRLSPALRRVINGKA